MDDGAGRKPLRKCVVCGAFRGKDELIRLAFVKGQEILIPQGKASPGKGIYLCADRECPAVFLKDKKYKKRFHRFMSESEQQALAGRCRETGHTMKERKQA
ncbi:MAG: DUF448 domain-containing protein [Candidatus Eremiobacteraeota bacterium]|nr:DUF448 domain-containing protein [Candidatus Eremiobacteraeota bacterium]